MPTHARLAAALGLAVLITGPAHITREARAQAAIVAPGDGFGPDEEGYARAYILGRPIIVGPSPIVGSIPLRPGTIVPGDVELTPFTDAPRPGLRRFGYFIAPGDKIVVVDPATRAVVRILDR